jgi:hypothetical protein
VFCKVYLQGVTLESHLLCYEILEHTKKVEGLVDVKFVISLCSFDFESLQFTSEYIL